MFRYVTVTALLAATGCRCTGPIIEELGPPVVEVSPTRLVFPLTCAGTARSLPVEVAHLQGSPATLTVGAAQAPFSATPSSLELSRGERATVSVTFAPQAAGSFAAKLLIGEAEVQLEGEAREPAVCTPSGARRDDARVGRDDVDVAHAADSAAAAVRAGVRAGLAQDRLLQREQLDAVPVPAVIAVAELR